MFQSLENLSFIDPKTKVYTFLMPQKILYPITILLYLIFTYPLEISILIFIILIYTNNILRQNNLIKML